MVAANIASILGSSEGAIKLLISLFLGYPLAFLYRSPLVYNLSQTAKHIFFIVVGLSICYYNFGLESAHLVINVTVIYLLLLVCGGTKFSVIFALVFNTSYLIVGYYYQMTYEFGISWTMPLCVVTLRLTAVAFDYYDGQKKDIPEDVKDSVLTDKPGYLELLGHVFFFGGVMVGPQFSLKRYLHFVNGNYVSQQTGSPPISIGPGLKRFALGVAYIFMFQSLALYIPDTYLESSDFHNKGFLAKCVFIVLWGKNSVNKYIGVWLIAEGVIILTGMSYNGVNEAGVVKWDACKNVSVWRLESGESFAEFIRSFNINTNQWMSRYIFKRLKFLGNKPFSQFVTLFYLALWHGLQSGYYVCFFLELLQTQAENQWLSVWRRCQTTNYLPTRPLWTLLGRALRKFILLLFWSYALVAFILHDYDRWFPVHESVYFVGFLLPIFMIIAGPILKSLIPVKSRTNGVHEEKLAKKKL